jgi:HD-GYP domain-containing protein (c-di-GMP phosphodiesterase class II)
MTRDMAAEAALRFEALPTNIDLLVESVINNPDALMWVARMRTQNTFDYQQGLRVASCLLAFGRHLGFQHKQLTHLGMIGLLLDIGKMRVDPAILGKNGKLSEAELAEARKHVEYGLEILSGTMEIEPEVLQGIGHHHEWINGQGYPNQLKQGAISLYGRMAAIADSYSAMTSTRPYANPLSSYDALRIIQNGIHEQFDAALTEQFIQALGIFPVGSLVELSNDEVAVVVSHTRSRRLEPQVLVLTDADKQILQLPRELHLVRQPLGPDQQPIRIRCGLPPGAHGIDAHDFYLV